MKKDNFASRYTWISPSVPCTVAVKRGSHSFLFLFVLDIISYHPDSSVGRVSTFGAGGCGFESRLHHTKGVKMVLAAPLLTLA